MAILSIALYGSCARNDHEEGSDVDLFALTDESRYQMVVSNNVNVACYPIDRALSRAASGDLFILHIVKEGRVIYDHCGGLRNLSKKFIYKDSYSDEIEEAAGIGWFISTNFNSFVNYSFLNKRAAWCVRTILIARSAERKAPVFAAKALAQTSNSEGAIEIIKNKNNEMKNPHIKILLDDFLRAEGLEKPNWVDDVDFIYQCSRLKNAGNYLAAKTVQSLISVDNFHEYI
jgi:predicted nucleotidyltransferase